MNYCRSFHTSAVNYCRSFHTSAVNCCRPFHIICKRGCDWQKTLFTIDLPVLNVLPLVTLIKQLKVNTVNAVGFFFLFSWRSQRSVIEGHPRLENCLPCYCNSLTAPTAWLVAYWQVHLAIPTMPQVSNHVQLQWFIGDFLTAVGVYPHASTNNVMLFSLQLFLVQFLKNGGWHDKLPAFCTSMGF